MYKLFVLFSFFTLQNVGYCLPPKVEIAIMEIGIKSGSVVFIMDHQECTSCINSDLSYALNYYKNISNNIFFLNENELGKEKLELILISAGFNVNERNIVQNEVLFKYLDKKSRLKKFNGKKFSNFEELHNYKNSSKGVSNLHPKVLDSFPLVERKFSLAYDLMKLAENLYFLSSDLGTISYLDQSESKSINLNSKIDTSKLLNLLNLDSLDLKQTIESFKKRKLVGDRFVEFKHFCQSDDENVIYITITVSNEHTYTAEEKQYMVEKSKIAKKGIKNINSIVTTTVNTPFLIKLNKNWEIENYYLINKSPEDYFIDIYSNIYIDSNRIYANPVYNPDVFTANFASNNFVVENFVVENNNITHSSFSEMNKSEWYNDRNHRLNFLSISFEKVSGNIFLKTTALPYWYNLSDNLLFEIPLKHLNKLAKKEKNRNYKKDLPAFVNLGILKLNSQEYIGFFRSTVTAKVYYAEFNTSGEFLNSYPLDIDTRYNGIIQVLDNKLVRLKEKHMLIYELN